MNDVIATALIAAVVPAIGSIIVQILINNKQRRVSEVKLDYTIKAIEEHIQRLELKQDKHNNLIERMVIVERDLKSSFIRLDELRSDIHEISKSIK